MSQLPITYVSPGATVRIASFEAGGRARARLCALGLTPGTVVQVEASGNGPCKLIVRGTELVLGHGLASKILVDTEAGQGFEQA
ncbi:MAG: FeoA family protein [Desulfovibrionales bacterium]